MDGQMQVRFLNHILKFFSAPQSMEEEGNNALKSDLGTVSGPEPAGCVDLPVLLGVLRAAGFGVTYTDRSEVGGTSKGCRVVIMCQRSAVRVVMEGQGPCTCPSQETLKQYLDSNRTGPPLSRAASPTPSTAGILEDAHALNSSFSRDHNHDAPKLARQGTWSKDDQDVIPEGAVASSPAGGRRMSAPPLQSAWSTFSGDELNVMAATDLLQEAVSLLAGVKKVNLRNTPIRAPARRLSATQAPPVSSRRASSDAFVQPMRPISRASSTSSGVGASSRSTSSLVSTESVGQKDTPRPVRPHREGAVLRRTVSAAGRSPAPAASSATPMKPPVTRTRADTTKKAAADSAPRTPGARGIKPPSSVASSKPTSTKPASTRLPQRSGTKSNSLSAATAKTALPLVTVTSPEVQGEAIQSLKSPDVHASLEIESVKL